MPEQRNGPDIPTGITFRHATTPDDLAACYDVIAALRPVLRSAEDWIARASRQMGDGYRVLAVWDTSGLARAVAGYRVAENLVYGRYLYVDDLICRPDDRSQGVGSAILREVERVARDEECEKLVLDTAVSNTDAQRFYRRAGLENIALGFLKSLGK